MGRDPKASFADTAKVLLVDDTPANLLALEAVLGPLDLHLVSTRSAGEALQYIERESFAVALIDVQMPEMDGFELTRRLRSLEFGRELPVLFVTAIHGDEAYVRKGYASGGADYITKPYDPQVIRARVKAFVNLYEQREAVRRGQVALRTQERDEAVRRLVALERIATAALETSDLQVLLEELLRACTEGADIADFAVVLLRDGQRLQVAASVGLEGDAVERFNAAIGQGFAGTVAAEQRPIELSEPADMVLTVGAQRGCRVRGLYGLPLMHGGEMLGVAHIGSIRAGSFSDAEKRLFTAAADRAALAVAKHLQLSDLHAILNTVPAYIAIVRVPGAEYTFANPAYRSLFGEELVGASTLGQRGFGAEALSAVEEVGRSGESVAIDELCIQATALSNGHSKPIYLRLSVQPLRNPSGKVERVLLFATDISAQVRARQEIDATHAMRAELLERERAARKAAELASISKDDFLAAVSHELRTPLNAILGWASLARAQKVPDLDRALAVIERNALAQARIVEDVLDFSRIARGKMRLSLSSVDIALVALESLETVRPAAEAKEISLEVDLQVSRKLVGDAQRLQQVAWNLLTNAIKFTKSGGRVTVRAVDTPARVTLSVTDNGQGIESDFLPYVFEPFRQASSGSTRAHGGLGLGLAIVKQIVLAHGGTVRVDSPGLGRGATFALEFPVEGTRKERASSAPASTQAVKSIPSLKPLRVLVVDDDEDSREFLACALVQRGATVASASGAAEAMRELEKFRPDVLVSDIAMPEADGYTLMRRVRALPPELGGAIPAVAITAHTRNDAWEHAKAAGFQLLEAKPVDLDHLAASIATLGAVNSARQLSD
jgi:signal transduction histidine kinase/PleD family two-component response regulator